MADIKVKIHTKRLWKKTVLFLMLGIIFMTSVYPVTLQASSAKWKKACKSYNAWLAKNVSKFKAAEFDFSRKNTENYKKADRFMIADLDKNGIPELIVTHPVAAGNDSIYVYTFKAGKVSQVRDIYGRKGKSAYISMNSQASGRYEAYKCRKNHLHVKWDGGIDGTEETIYSMSKGKLKQYARANEVDISGLQNQAQYSYMINGRNVTEKEYKSLVKKCGKSHTGFVSNTKANRKKYLKG